LKVRVGGFPVIVGGFLVFFDGSLVIVGMSQPIG